MSIVSEPLGRVLGNRYQVVAALGTGASAHVFLAEDMVLQRRVAVKVLQPALARDEVFLRRFRAEARSVASLNHPHVLRVFDWGEDDDGPYLVLEYLEGGSLFDILNLGRRLTPAQAARVGAQAAEGLAYAHARGLVHRDVKPANLLFDEEGRVRVADFGVARALASAAATEPIGSVVGTTRYVSPEQAQGDPLDGRSDVYSLAVVLFEAVTGTSPFRGETPVALLHARIGATLPAAPELGLLQELLRWAANPDVTERPDAATFALRMDRLADDLSPAPPLPLARRAPAREVPPEAASLTRVQEAVSPLPSSPVPSSSVPSSPVPSSPVPSSPVPSSSSADAEAPTSASLTVHAPPLATTAGATVHGSVDTGEPTAALLLGSAPALTYLPQGGPPRRTGRRWPWVAAIAVLVAALLAAGGVYAVKKRLFTPSHRVPALVGQSLTTARKALEADHFDVLVAPAVQSLTVKSGAVVSERPKHGVLLKEGSTVWLVPSAGLPSETVPSLVNADCVVARQLLAETHLKANCPALSTYTKTVPDGNIINWSYQGKLDPPSAPYGATITIAVSEGKPPVQLPSFAGETWTQASATLGADGLSAKQAQAYSTTVPSGRVISTTPGQGATVPADSTVTVIISKGPETVTVPNVTNDTVAKATSVLQKAGLTVGSVYGPATGRVFTTVPLAGQRVKVGTAVTLYTQRPGRTGGTPTNGLGGTAGTA
jgi:eukaryotic-like serine/threonine-protein kinase